MAVRRGLPVDGAPQIEVLDNRAGAEIEVLIDQLDDELFVHLGGAEGFDSHGDGVRDSDGVGQLKLDPVCQPRVNDVLGGITQLMVHFITGQIAAYLEFYEFMVDRVLMGVPDFVPSEVVDGKVRVTTTQFGEISGGVLNISKVKTGRVTLCRLTSTGDRYALHILTGEAVQPRKWEEAGWDPPAPQLPSLEVILDTPVEEFAQKVMSQHYIVAYGDHRAAFQNLCALLDIDVL